METIVIILAAAYFILQARSIIIEEVRYRKAKVKQRKMNALHERIDSLIQRGIELNVHIIELYMTGHIADADLLKEQADDDVKKIEKLCKEYEKLLSLK